MGISHYPERPLAMNKDVDIEYRIDYEIVVDCYGEYERATGWHCYLDDRLDFPFPALCDQVLPSSPLKEDEEVTVTGMADQNDCFSTMLVQVQWQDRSLSVPLSQLTVDEEDVSEDTFQAIGDWTYWTEYGYSF